MSRQYPELSKDITRPFDISVDSKDEIESVVRAVETSDSPSFKIDESVFGHLKCPSKKNGSIGNFSNLTVAPVYETKDFDLKTLLENSQLLKVLQLKVPNLGEHQKDIAD